MRSVVASIVLAAILGDPPEIAAAETGSHDAATQPRRVGLLLSWSASGALTGLRQEIESSLSGQELVWLSTPPASLMATEVVNYCQSLGIDSLAIVRITSVAAERQLTLEVYDADGDLARTRALFSSPPTDAGPSVAPVSPAALRELAHVGGSEFYSSIGRADLASQYLDRQRALKISGIVGAATATLGLSALILGSAIEAVGCVDSSPCKPARAWMIVPTLMIGCGTAALLAGLLGRSDPVNRARRIALEEAYEEEHTRARVSSRTHISAIQMQAAVSRWKEAELILSARF